MSESNLYKCFVVVAFYTIYKKYYENIFSLWKKGVKFFATPLQGGAIFFRGVRTIDLQTYKQRADIWLTYIYIYGVIYHLLKILACIFTKTLHIFNFILFKRVLIKKILIKFSLVWPYPYLSSLILWKYYLSDSKSLLNGKYVYLEMSFVYPKSLITSFNTCFLTSK